MNKLQYLIEGALLTVEIIISLFLWYSVIKYSFGKVNNIVILFMILLFLHGISLIFRLFMSLEKMNRERKK
jgi:hypothetical protein